MDIFWIIFHSSEVIMPTYIHVPLQTDIAHDRKTNGWFITVRIGRRKCKSLDILNAFPIF